LAKEILTTLSGTEDYSVDMIVFDDKLVNDVVINEQHQEKQAINQNAVDNKELNVNEQIAKSIITDNSQNIDENVNIDNNKTFVSVTNNNETNSSNNLQNLNFDILKDEITKLVKEKLLVDKDIFTKPENEIKEELEKYYKEVNDKTDKVLKTLENAGMEKSILHQNMNNVKSNISFMNDLNNMALYMQFPVKFNENEAHGELYVLNRNRGKKVEKDVLTAFLHLDMENLGATDVNIRLEKEQLTTKFTLEDTISQDIVEEHLPELQKRLEEKGYFATLLVEEISKDDDNVYQSPFEQVLALQEPKNIIKRYTLDVRA